MLNKNKMNLKGMIKKEEEDESIKNRKIQITM